MGRLAARTWILVVASGTSAALMAAQERPADRASQPWMLFFDWGKTEIRTDDRATLDEVADTVSKRPTASIKIIGHTDRSGSRAANLRAGSRRAELVRLELVRRGIPRNAISVTSLGEDQPLITTEDGVREVQNRRVEIHVAE